MKKTGFVLCLLFLFLNLSAAEWQWSAAITNEISGETNDHPRAFLWAPSDCKQVNGIVVGMHNMQEEGIFEHKEFRKTMAEIGFAEIWVTPGFGQLFDVTKGDQTAFDEILYTLAEVSGYSEIKYAPVVPIGHSAYATYPWNYAAWNPDKTLAILSVHGDAPQTNLTGCGRPNLDWENRTTDGIPGLMVMGEYEWWEDRLTPAFAYKNKHPQSPVSLLADAGHGHFDYSDSMVKYLALFVKKAAYYRLPTETPLDKPVKLKPIDPASGWLADRWHPEQTPPSAKAAPYHQYKGDKSTAFWYFDKEMATETENFYAVARGKKSQYISFMQNNELLSFNEKLHARINARFEPENDGLTFHISATFTDSLRHKLVSNHSNQGTISIDRICGPIEKINDSTFTVRFYRMGLNNRKRTGDIWLIARHNGDAVYKSTVQQLNLHIPHKNTEGKEQHISFPTLGSVVAGTESIALNATSDSGLPVYYYLKEGPAEVEGNRIIFTKIPPKAKFPLKVTVVAWQYGRAVGEKIQTAAPVERSFYITQQDFSSLEKKITSWVDSAYYDGASLMIAKDNRIIYSALLGNHTPETVLHIASAGKWLAAATIAAVVDDRKLSWDDKVKKYLPEFKDIKGEASLRQLLSHTSGYPDYQPENRHRDDYQTLEESVKHIVNLPADTLPGTKFRYGGLAMQVAGRMAEIATGKDWETLFQEKIAQPLQMRYTHFTPVSQESGFSPMLGGSAYTSAPDYMNFLNMIFNRGVFQEQRILSEESIREMQADQVKQALVHQPEYVMNARQNIHKGIYGLGEWREEIDENGEAVLISSPGWAGAYSWIDKKNNIYGFFLAKVNVHKANADGFSSFYSSPELVKMVRNALAPTVLKETETTVSSPDGKQVFTFYQKKNANGTLEQFYKIDFDSQPLVLESKLDIQLDNHIWERALAKFWKQPKNWNDLMVFDKVETASHNETWKPLYGERSEIKDNYNAATIHFSRRDNSGYKMNIEVRAYNEGIAFRYSFPMHPEAIYHKVISENTEFTMPEGTTAWWTQWAQAPYYEQPLKDWEDESERPLTLKLSDNLYACITEAKQTDFPKTAFKLSNDKKNTIQTSLYGSSDMVTPFGTPWRVVMASNRLGQLLENNDILLNLNDVNKIVDADWIKPGKIMRETTLTTLNAKDCIDFCANHHMQYILFDWKWYGPSFDFNSDASRVVIPGLDMKEVVAYGKSKGIGVWLYVNQHALQYQADRIFPIYKEWGIAGVKFGFVQFKTQGWATWVHDLVKKAADNHLMVNIHDEYRPTGFSRTYPNLLTQEGIRGNEEFPDATHNTTLPFTRMIAGAADYTVCYFDPRIKNTHAHQLALPVVFYSPLQTLYWYDTPARIEDVPELDFFDKAPVTWDETQVIHDKIGEYVTIARRNNEDWFVGTIGNNDARKITTSLNFLKNGQKYVAHIYNTDERLQTSTKVKITTVIVDNTTLLPFLLKERDGCAIRLSPATKEDLKQYKAYKKNTIL